MEDIIMDLKGTKTEKNLLEAFAGESMARNRYTIAASEAKKQKKQVIEAVFTFTAGQEKEHAEIFYNHLKEYSEENVNIEGGYPVDIKTEVLELLKAAQHNEYEEYEPVYKDFAAKAKEEGFYKIASSFELISEIEKTHGDRFGLLAELIEQNKLFISDVSCKWMCLNCGYIFEGKEVPEACPVCQHDKGYFIRLELAPFSS